MTKLLAKFSLIGDLSRHIPSGPFFFVMLEWHDGKRKWISFGAPLRDSSNRNVEEVNIYRYVMENMCMYSLFDQCIRPGWESFY